VAQSWQALQAHKGDTVREESSMKKAPRNDELRAEYDSALIRGGARGKYAKRYRAGTNLVWLAPDVAAAFPNSESVNEALRLLLKLRASVR
jgi:hypothetical protein